MTDNNELEAPKGELLFYQSSDGQVQPQNITMHLKNIYSEGELSETATCKDFLQVQIEGTRSVERNQKFYNLDAIISVGYRVKSAVATRFRVWATERLKEYIVKGFATFVLRKRFSGAKCWIFMPRAWITILNAGVTNFPGYKQSP